MMMGQMTQNWWVWAVEIAKWAARLPIILLIILTAGMVSWTVFWFIYRVTEYTYKFLNHSW